MSSTACQFLSEVLPGWPDRGAEHTQWTGMPSLSGGIKADLIAAGIECAESLWGQSGIAPGFQQAKSDILERTNALGKSLAKQTALFHQLEKQVCNLEQVVEDFASGVVLAVGVFQVETAIFLDVEAFVFDLPT